MDEELKRLYILALDDNWRIFSCTTEDNVVTIRLTVCAAGPFAVIKLMPSGKR